MIQSNLFRSSPMILPTPSSVSASLSRVCEAGRPQVFQALVAYKGLREVGNALHHVDEIEHHSPFRAEYQIEVAQADIEVDHDDFFSHLRQRGSECGGRRRLADATFSGRHNKDFGHSFDLPKNN